MTNTINNVPRELLERLANTSVTDYEALGNNKRELRALLSTPSPAGVDGLEVIGKISVSFDEGDDGVAIELVALSCLLDEGDTEICRLSDAQAIIDGLRGEVERFTGLWELELTRAQKAENDATHFAITIDQQAQRIGELEGLLRAESARVDFLDAHIVTADAPHTGKVAMLADSGTLRERIDAALSAGKEGE